jgi:glycolate oxidase subunit GlcD
MALSDPARAALREIVGADAVHTDLAALLTYSRDAGLVRGRPEAVVLPVSAEQVSALVRWAAGQGMPVTGWGAGTGQTGGAVAVHGGLVIAFANMRRLLDLDAEGRQALVEPGIITAHLDRAARDQGLIYPPDPASDRASSIGGNVAENAGGPRCCKYGVTSHYVLGLTTVLADGSVVDWGGPALDTPEINFLDVLVGSEGTLALTTAARLRLMPRPEAVGTMMASFRSPEQAGQAVSAIIRSGLRPAALELLDGLLYSSVERSAHMNLAPGAGALLIADVEGFPDSLASNVRRLEEAVRPFDPLEVRLATSETEREAIWYARKSAFAATAWIAPDDCSMDVVVPRSRLPETFRKISQMGHHAGYQVGYLAHAGDGNIHPEIFCDLGEPGALARVHELQDQIIRYIVGIGGSISGEHGVGLEKQRHLGLMYGPDELRAMLEVKTVFDPQDRLNPGKIFPAMLPATPAPAALGSHDLDTPLRPTSVRELQEIMADLQAQRRQAWLGGGGTKCALLNGDQPDATRISTTGLAGILTRAYDDLYLTVAAGSSVAAVAAELAEDGFILPLAAPWPDATIGGTVAAQFNAPWRGAYSGIREAVLCAEVVLPDGRVLRLGRPLVKDVAGYSLHKLFIGSFGTLGALTALSLRVYPQEPARSTWRVACPDLTAALAAARVLGRPADLVNTLLLFRGAALPDLTAGTPYHVVCTYAGSVEDVAIAKARGIRGLAEAKLPAPIPLEATGLDLWAQALRQANGGEALPGATRRLQTDSGLSASPLLLRAGVAPSALPSLLAATDAAALAVAVADLTNGLLYLAGSEPAAVAPAWEAAVRVAAQAAGGYALALGRGVYPPRGMQMAPEACHLLADLTRRWDPAGIFNAGVFAGQTNIRITP